MPKAILHSDASRMRTLAHTPSAAVEVDEVVVVNGRVCIAYADVAADAEGQFIYQADEVEVPTAEVAITEGDAAYYDVGNEVFTNVAGSEPANTPCGIFRAAAADSDETGNIELNPAL